MITLWFAILMMILSSCGEGGLSGSLGAGAGGSTSRFTIVNDHLYILNHSYRSDYYDNQWDSGREAPLDSGPLNTNGSYLSVYSLEDPEDPNHSGDLELSFFMPETLHSNGDYLFIGASSAMYVYSLQDPTRPEYTSAVSHFSAKDPVVTESDRAYVTIRTKDEAASQAERQRFFSRRNQLYIYDIKNIDTPVTIAVKNMNYPFGLGVKNRFVYICDGSVGLKVLDTNNINAIIEIETISDEICRDVIVKENRVITTGILGISQYEIDKETNKLKLLSRISISEEEV